MHPMIISERVIDDMREIPAKVKNKKLVEQRREKIVLAAIKLFSRSGFHTTTMRELAVEAGISSGNIYEYVSTKEDIFFLIHDFMHNISINGIKQAIKGVKDPLEKLRRMVRSEFNVMYMWANAVLLIYQESHILNKPLLYELLKKEREHIGYFEKVIEECVEKGILKKVNVRLLANLIKVMTEAWVVKRWDLRGYVERTEMETMIIQIIFDYVGDEIPSKNELQSEFNAFSGKTALVINSETLIGKAVTSWLLSQGVKVTVFKDKPIDDEKTTGPFIEEQTEVMVYNWKKHGKFDYDLFREMLKEAGNFDFLIHDLSAHYSGSDAEVNNQKISDKLDSNLKSARNVAQRIYQNGNTIKPAKIIYIAPWGWDSYADPLTFGMVNSSVSMMVKILAEQLAEENSNINCVSPGFIGGIRPLKIEKKKKKELMTKVPMRSIGEISDVVGAVKYLLSDGSKYITGQTLYVSGGFNQNLSMSID